MLEWGTLELATDRTRFPLFLLSLCLHDPRSTALAAMNATPMHDLQAQLGGEEAAPAGLPTSRPEARAFESDELR